MQVVIFFSFLTGLYVDGAQEFFSRYQKDPEKSSKHSYFIQSVLKTKRIEAERKSRYYSIVVLVSGIAAVVLKFVLDFPDFDTGIWGYAYACFLALLTVLYMLDAGTEIIKFTDHLMYVTLSLIASAAIVAVCYLSSSGIYDYMDKDMSKADIHVNESVIELSPVNSYEYYWAELSDAGGYSREELDQPYYLVSGSGPSNGPFAGRSAFYYYPKDGENLVYAPKSNIRIWYVTNTQPRIVKKEVWYSSNLSNEPVTDSVEYDVYVPTENFILN